MLYVLYFCITYKNRIKKKYVRSYFVISLFEQRIFARPEVNVKLAQKVSYVSRLQVLF